MEIGEQERHQVTNKNAGKHSCSIRRVDRTALCRGELLPRTEDVEHIKVQRATDTNGHNLGSECNDNGAESTLSIKSMSLDKVITHNS